MIEEEMISLVNLFMFYCMPKIGNPELTYNAISEYYFDYWDIF